MEENEVNVNQQLSEINRILVEIRNLLRFSSRASIKELLENELNTEDKVKVYRSFNGANSVRDIEKLVGVNRNTISEWGQRWESCGLLSAESNSSKAKRKSIFLLSDFGIISSIKDD